jgi:hypothetical protein
MKNLYILFAALVVFITPLSMQASETSPTSIFGNEKRPMAGCEGVTVTGGSGSITVAGLGSYSHVQVFTPGFASQVFNQEITTATLTVPVTTAGEYIVKVWSNPNPAAFCENNFPVTVGGSGGGSTLTLNGCNNASATAAAGATSAIVTYTMPTATTTCATGGAAVTRTSGGASGTAFPVGTSQVCFSATDNCGNTKQCCITITVTAATGGSVLTLNGCTDVSVTAAAGDRSAIVNYTTPTATTTCATGGAAVTRTSGGASGTAFPVGTSQVCFSATDHCGNTKQCCITITVTAGTGGGGGNVCTTPSTSIVGGAGSITVNDISTSCAQIQVFTSAWVPVYNQQVTGTSATIPNLTAGSFIVKVTVLGAGCQWPAVCNVQSTVTVSGGGDPCATDVTAPVFAGCPTNINLTTQGTCANASWTAPTATDNCGVPTITQPLGGANGSCFPVGTTLVKYMATDAKGNTAICVFNVVVTQTVVDPCATDVTAPAFAGCPTNISLTTTGTCANASWTAPTATDNCGVPTITQPLGGANGSCFPVGTTLVKYMATDAKGNTAICVFNVVVTKIVVDPCATDATAPVFTNCPANIVKTPTAAGACWTVSWTAPTATDNCGVPTITQTTGPTNGSCLTPGTYGVTYKATDAKGNVATCTFIITVNSYLNCNSVVGNTISKSCVNNVPSLNGAALAGFEYQWMSSTVSCPTQTSQAIAGATGQHYTLPSRVSVTTYFVRCARPIGCTTWGTINESNCITVYPSDCAPTICTAPPTPAGWMYLGSFGTSHYYKYTVSGDLTSADARTKAASIGARLPVIKSAAQNAFIQSKLAGGNAWIGIRRSGNSWVWDNNAVATYYNWAAGEPNNYGGNEHCAQIYGHGTWNDLNCSSYNWLIAEIPCGGLHVYASSNDQISIDGSAELSRTRISWLNNTGYKNDYFTIEKANPTSGDFEELAVVNNKYSTDANEYYTVYDESPTEGDNTYRVKVNYVDGTSKISDLKTITYKGTSDIRLFPNPANDVLSVDLTKYKGLDVTISLYNQFGQQVLTQQIEKAGSGAVILDVSKTQAGNYLIRVVAKGRKDAVKQLHIAK